MQAAASYFVGEHDFASFANKVRVRVRARARSYP